MSGLAIRDLGLQLDGRHILKGASLVAPAGKITALLGPSGSGKTALLRAVAGLEMPDTGSIQIDNELVFDDVKSVEQPAERRGIGFVFRSDALWPHRTVAENVAFCARLQGDTADAAARVGAALSQAGIGALAGRRPTELSAAQRARVALARALVGKPRLLLLDDPLSGLAGDDLAAARSWLRQTLAETGLTALLATASRADAFMLAEHIALIHAGTVEQEGPPHDLYTAPATQFVAEFMGAGNRIEGTLIEKAGPRAFIDVMGARLGGVARTLADVGDKATGMIRSECILLGGGPGANRLGMKLQSQAYLGERWELTFVKETITVRANATAPLRHEFYHLEFPPDALWIY